MHQYSIVLRRVCTHILLFTITTCCVWFLCRRLMPLQTWQLWRDQLGVYDFLTSPRVTSFTQPAYVSAMYALAWSFPRTACVIHAYWRTFSIVAIFLIASEPFPMLGTHYLLQWFFHVVLSEDLNLENVGRAMLLFSKARAWMKRVPVLGMSTEQRIAQVRYQISPWTWPWKELAGTTVSIFVLHLYIGSWLTFYHLIQTLVWF